MAKVTVGTVSAGTLREEDLRLSFTAEICYLSDGAATADCLGLCNHPTDSDCLCNDIDTLMDAINEYAPPHLYFGTHEGDGADFGWWPTDFDECERVDEHSGPNGECEFIDIACDIYVEVNDHGNVAVYEVAGKGRGALIWDCV